MYLYGFVSLLALVSRLCYVISNQSTSEKPHVLDLSELEALLHKIHSKVLLLLRYQGSTRADT